MEKRSKFKITKIVSKILIVFALIPLINSCAITKIINPREYESNCCEGFLINEGDLNIERREELSIIQAPNYGCTYTMTTYSFDGKNWSNIVQILIPTDCEPISKYDFEDRVYSENRTI